MAQEPQAKLRNELQTSLLGWYRKYRRKLPWRETRDPYKIWVSEMMLQQTQVETVLPYYKRWLKAFPDVFSLARVPEPKVLKLWEGLGYYSRAKNLRRAAQIIVVRYGGVMPRNETDLLRLPGIGKYTARAILSIAFNQDYPVVDGNVSRVLARVFFLRNGRRRPNYQRRLWEIAAALLPQGQARDFNQALMELGATLCKPRKPSCPLCPVQRLCRAHQLGCEEEVPRVRVRPKTEAREAACALLSKNGRFLIVQFPPGELWAGLWGLPEARREKGAGLLESLLLRLERLGIQASPLRKLSSVQRSYTRYREKLHVFSGQVRDEKRSTKETLRWVSYEDLKHYALPAAHSKILRHILSTPKAYALSQHNV